MYEYAREEWNVICAQMGLISVHFSETISVLYFCSVRCGIYETEPCIVNIF
jgi:hypothetical protein